MCVGFSRIGLGKHYAADVAAGMLVGYLAAVGFGIHLCLDGCTAFSIFEPTPLPTE